MTGRTARWQGIAVGLFDLRDCLGYGAEFSLKFPVRRVFCLRCDTRSKFLKFAKRAPYTNCVVMDPGGIDRGEQTLTKQSVLDNEIDLRQRQ
ncbi:MAG: hypothetical protein OEL91_07210 [Burkholderiaceae bacterium]|nr:hypothetical protein [Burkholderiaceae bacterium]